MKRVKVKLSFCPTGPGGGVDASCGKGGDSREEKLMSDIGTLIGGTKGDTGGVTKEMLDGKSREEVAKLVMQHATSSAAIASQEAHNAKGDEAFVSAMHGKAAGLNYIAAHVAKVSGDKATAAAHFKAAAEHHAKSSHGNSAQNKMSEVKYGGHKFGGWFNGDQLRSGSTKWKKNY